MAKWFRRQVAALPPVLPAPLVQNAVVAAATRIQQSAYGRTTIPISDWQKEAATFAENTPELSFAIQWLENCLSRCRLIPAAIDRNGRPDLAKPVPPEVHDILDGLMGCPAKQAEMLAAFGYHLSVPGDGYIIGEVAEDGTFSRWYVVSNEEITSERPGFVRIDRGDGAPYIINVETNLVIRVHRPNPRKWFLATSPVKASLPILREIYTEMQYVFAILESRLAGNGILFLPNELSFPTPKDAIEGEDPWVTALAEGMITPIGDRGSASAVVPIVVKGPKDALDAIKHMRFDSELTGQVAEWLERAIKRLATGLEIPAEVLLGTGTSNHWGAWQVEENAIKLHIEPIMLLICNAITEGYLKPALRANGLDEHGWTVWFDSSDLVLRPNRAQDAKDLHAMNLLSDEAVRRENGFSESDAPTQEEQCRNAAIQLLTAAPNAVTQLLPSLVPLFGLDKCGITPEDVMIDVSVDPNGGTAAKPASVDPGADPKALPNPQDSVDPTVNPKATPSGATGRK